jgi:hypothetical protein
LLAASASADTNIIYTFSGTGDGSIGAMTFTNTSFVIRVLADTNLIYTIPEPGFIIFGNDSLSSSIEVTGIGTAGFTTGTKVFVNQTGSVLGFSRSGDQSDDLLDLTNPAFASYDLRLSFAPVFLPGPGEGFGGQPSTLGLVNLSSTKDITFGAAVAFPSLLITHDGNTVVLRWTANSPGYQLESTDTISPLITWTTVTNGPAINGNQYAVTNQSVTATKIYRLRK